MDSDINVRNRLDALIARRQEQYQTKGWRKILRVRRAR